MVLPAFCSGPPHAHDLQPARQFSVEQNDQPWALQRLIYPWSSGHWQLKGVLDAQKGGQFELCHITRGDYYERHHQKAQQQQLEISMRAKWNQEIPTGGPCMYGFRASILLPHQSTSSPDTYLNHAVGPRTPLEKVLLFSAKGKHFPFGVRGPTA